MPNYEALRTGAPATGLPADGHHQATLDRAAYIETKNGDRLVTEWTTADGTASWTSWNRADATGIAYTIELLDALGVDRGADIEVELERVTGHVYDVRTSVWGNNGDQVNTYVDGKALGVQEALDVPIDTSGLSPPPAAQDDDDIPF